MSFTELLFFSTPLLLGLVLCLVSFILRRKGRTLAATITFLIGVYTVPFGAAILFFVTGFLRSVEFLFLGSPVLLTFGLFLMGFILRRKNRVFAASIIFLIGFYIVFFTAYFWLVRGSYMGFYLAAPLSGAYQVVAIIIALLLASRLYPSYIFGNSQGEDYSKPLVLKDAVSKILDSENFLTALRSSLPR